MENIQQKVATYRRIGDQYEIEIPGHPTGFTFHIKELYSQLRHLKKQGFSLTEDKTHPIPLEDRLPLDDKLC